MIPIHLLFNNKKAAMAALVSAGASYSEDGLSVVLQKSSVVYIGELENSEGYHVNVLLGEDLDYSILEPYVITVNTPDYEWAGYNNA